MTKQEKQRLETLISNIYLTITGIEQAYKIAARHEDKAMCAIYETKIDEKMRNICNLWFLVTGEFKVYEDIIKQLGLDKKGVLND